MGTVFSPISQTSTPSQIVTEVEASGTELRIRQTDSLTSGNQYFRTDITILNDSDTAREVRLWRAMDCYLGDNDYGGGSYANGMASCTGEGGRIEAFEPLTAGAQYQVAGFSTIWDVIENHNSFPDTIQSGEYDNGMGISWDVTVPANGEVTLSHNTWFAPRGLDPQPPREVTPVPTLSEWGMILMSLLMLGLGMRQVLRTSKFRA